MGSTYESAEVGSPVAGPDRPVDAPVAKDPAQVSRDPALPENFKSVEDLTKSYKALQAELTKKSQAAPKPVAKAPAEAPKDPPKDPPKAVDPLAIPPKPPEEEVKAGEDAKDPEAPLEPAKELESKGLDIEEFSAEYLEKGELTDASYDKLAKAGFGRELVDAHIAGQIAMGEKFTSEVQSVVGGADQYAEVTAWAALNLAPEEALAFNEVLDTRNINQIKLAVSGLQARFIAAHGQDPNLLGGEAPPNGEPGYGSFEEQVRDQRNPEYRTNPAFRDKVERRIAATR